MRLPVAAERTKSSAWPGSGVTPDLWRPCQQPVLGRAYGQSYGGGAAPGHRRPAGLSGT